MANSNDPACTFRNLLCAEEDCDNYALEPERRAACQLRYADGTADHTPVCRMNLVDILEQRRKYPDAVAVVSADYGPEFPKSALRAAPCSEKGAELGYCATHSNPGGRDAKVRFWEQCEYSRSLRLRGEKIKFLEEYAKYVKTVKEWCRVDLDALVRMPSSKMG
ncbi:hypothetical protein PG997_007438 [Apiospora hydei]|uniref:Uncharacterized protein n=1 Tax=Apiospora hydei TaxID=1337664 RepID=A0ABR1W801_9PEZI